VGSGKAEEEEGGSQGVELRGEGSGEGGAEEGSEEEEGA
jgi:hypothetical protein